MRRFAVLADVHGNLPALLVVAADIERRGITTVFNLGDHASGPLWPHETLAFLMQQPWVHIAGNHDRQLVHQDPATHGTSDQYAFAQLSPTQKHWLATLPASCSVTPDMLLCHGTPTVDNHYLLETVAHGSTRLASHAEIALRLGEVEADLVACAHSHMPRLVQFTETQLIVNPGSVGVQAYEATKPEQHIVATGSPHTRYAIVEQGDQGWDVEFVALTYDHLSAANQARQQGRSDWEIALRTGNM